MAAKRTKTTPSSVCRVNKNGNYTVMSNYHLRSPNLSLKAVGLLSRVLALPDDWDYSVAGLVAICKEKETTVKSALDELKYWGYLRVTKLKPNETKSGRIEYVYDFFEYSEKDVPQDNSEKEPCGKQGSEKQGIEILPLEIQGAEIQGTENQWQINTNKKIKKNKIFIALTAYARTHMSECCLLFTIRNGELKDEYVAGELHRIEDKSSLCYLYEYNDKDVVGTAVALTQIMSHIPTGFGETMTFHMDNLRMTKDQLAERSLISTRTIARMRGAAKKMPSLESILAVSIGMSLYPELSQDLMNKADRRFDSTKPVHVWYMVIMRTMYRESIFKCNELLKTNGYPPLAETSE